MKKDIDLTLNKNYITDNINQLTGAKKYNQQLKNLMLLMENDFKYDADISLNIYNQIGENFSPVVINLMKQKITELIDIYMSEIELVDVIIKFNFEQQFYKINIQYSIVNTIDVIELTTTVRKI
jgi:hypothetical protein